MAAQSDNHRNKSSQHIFMSIVSLLLFTTGLILNLLFNSLVTWSSIEGMAFWGYPESIAYDNTLTTEASISRLRCPTVLSPGEIGWAKLTISNPNNHPIRTWISAHISQAGRSENMVRRTRSLSLSPGTASEMVWQVTDENTIFDRMILVRVFLRLTENHPPSRTQHCGILFLDLVGLTGTQILWIAVLGSLILQLLGIILWRRAWPIIQVKENLALILILGMFLLSLIATIGSVFSLWFLSLIGLILIPLLLFSILGYYFGKLDRQLN